MEGAPPEEASASISKETSSTVSLRILSPSFESNQRLSFDNLALSTTVAEVKNLITPLAPTHPTADQQRLIYRGKPLLNRNATLENILEPPLAMVHTLHLVLPPGPEISNNIYATSDSALRYRHAANRSPNPSGAQPFAASTGSDIMRENPSHVTTTASSQVPGQPSTLSGLNTPSTQPPPPVAVGHQSHEELLRQNLEQHRRRAEELNTLVDRARSLFNVNTTRMRVQSVNIQRTENLAQFPRSLSANGATGVPGSNIQTPLNLHNLPNNGISQSLLLARITSQLMLLELEVERGLAPSIDSIAAVRGQLYAILDARYRQPTVAPTGIEVEGLLLRLQHVNTRAYQIRQSEYLRGLSSIITNRGGNIPQTTQPSEYYLITTPSGEQMILTPPAPLTVQNPPETIPVFPEQQQELVRNEVDPMEPNVLHNVVRQAVLDQQPARNNNNDHFALNLRRFWLFMRLYFFCYLFTDSNSWERFVFVGLAALFALFSETNITSRLFNTIVQPIQRHLEGLIHGDTPARAPTHQGMGTTNNENNEPNQNRAPPTGGAQQSFRRIERSLALFIASLIPGLGERQVEVRNAAEEAARNARQQEQARIEEENARNQDNTAVNQDEASAAIGETAETRQASNNVEPQAQQQAEY